MHMFTIPIGQLEVTVEILRLSDTQKLKCGIVPTDGAMFVGPGDTQLLNVLGYPLVITVVRKEMMVAHVKKPEIIATIIKTFLEHGAASSEIQMCVQFATADHETSCIEQARQIGLRNVWAMNSFLEFQAQMLRTHENFLNDWNFTKVTRTA